MPSTYFVAYMNGDGFGIAFASPSLKGLNDQMQKSPGFYLVRRNGRDVGVFTSQLGLQVL